MLGLGTAILEIAGLSVLGPAGEVDLSEWGAMPREGKDSLRSSFRPVLAPGTAISLTVLGCNRLGESLRAGFDRRWRGQSPKTRAGLALPERFQAKGFGDGLSPRRSPCLLQPT